MRYGIEALNVYAGLAQLPVPVLFAGRGLDQQRLENLRMRQRSIGLPFEDPVTNAVNAAKPIIDALPADQVERIELLVTSTESGLDLSKSVASYVHAELGLSRHCRVMEVKQACYAATGVLQLAVGQLAAGFSPGAKALIIATDVALVDERAGYAEPATGHGAVAVLLSDRPDLLAIDLGASGSYSYETLDSARPTPEFDIADVDRSLFAYLDCLVNSFRHYCSRVDGVDFATTFDQLAFHTPFAGLVGAAHRKMMREFSTVPPDRIGADFERRVALSLEYPARVGNLCSGSLYLALASVIEHGGTGRIGLYSYGSGCASEFFSGVIGQNAADILAGMRIGEHLDRRQELSFDEYSDLLTSTLKTLIPEPNRDVDVQRYARFLPTDVETLVRVGTKDYHRRYEWR